MKKSAGFIEGFLRTAIDKIGFRESPFETIFGLLGPAIIFRISKLLGLVAFAAEALGYGPGLIGKAIDEYLKAGGADDVSEMNLNDSSLKAASTFAMSDLFKNTVGKTSSADYFLENIYMIKKSVNTNDIISSCYAGNIHKEARSRTGLLANFLRKVFKGQSLGIANLLYGLLKLFATGLIGLGIAGGIKETIKDVKKKPEDKELPKSNLKYFENKRYSVEDTIINLLNTIRFKEGNFEEVFQKLYKKPLKNSNKMDKLLSKISYINKGAPINIMDQWDAFYAPKLKDMANFLIPEYSYGGNDELSKFLKGL